MDGIYRDTWNYLASSANELTGIPYDSSARQPASSLSNAGLYLAATAIAERTGLISRKEALARLGTCLVSLRKIETWRGIPRPWFLVKSLRPTHGDEFSYGSHLANLLGGLVIVKMIFPELDGLVSSLLGRMDFSDFYDAKNGWLKAGYNVKHQNFAVFQAWGHWYHKYFASETRLLSFFLIAGKKVPPEHWFALIRPERKEDGEVFYAAGPEDGGLFTQFLSGLFLEEGETEMGNSQRRFARAQMKHAARIDSPVWGWSSCESPDGRYLAYGELRDELVAPYASLLAAIYFPRQAAQNLQEIEKFGARPGSLGFLDSVNWQTAETARHYLTANQAMAFLSLANLLHDGIVWKTFAAYPVAAQGLEILASLEKSS